MKIAELSTPLEAGRPKAAVAMPSTGRLLAASSDRDPSGMRKVILDFPCQFEKGVAAGRRIHLRGAYKHAIICGMGGSALAGILLKAWLRLEGKPYPLHIVHDYRLPRLANKKDLIICVSYSGNTEETLSNYRDALRKKFTIVSVGTGGMLQKLSKKNKTPFAAIPQTGIQPRAATGYLFGALAAVLEKAGIARNIAGAVTAEARNLKSAAFEREGRSLAKKIGNKIPLVYASCDYQSLAHNWKIKFNENAKTHAFYNFFPELNHNEMLGFASRNDAKKFHVVILRDRREHPRIQKRMNLTATLLKKNWYSADTVTLLGNTNFQKMFNALMLGDWASYYLALKKGLDPTPIAMIEEFKGLL